MDSLPVEILQIIANYSGETAYDVRLLFRKASKCRVILTRECYIERNDYIHGRTNLRISPDGVPIKTLLPDVTTLSLAYIPAELDLDLLPNLTSLDIYLAEYTKMPDFPVRIKHIGILFNANVDCDIPCNIKKITLRHKVVQFLPRENELTEIIVRVRQCVLMVPPSVQHLRLVMEMKSPDLQKIVVSHTLKTLTIPAIQQTSLLKNIKAETIITFDADRVWKIGRKVIHQYVMHDDSLTPCTYNTTDCFEFSNSTTQTTIDMKYISLPYAKCINLSGMRARDHVINIPKVRELDMVAFKANKDEIRTNPRYPSAKCDIPDSVRTLTIYHGWNNIPDHIEFLKVFVYTDDTVDYSHTKLKKLDVSFVNLGYYQNVYIPRTLRRLRLLYNDKVKIVLMGDKLERYKEKSYKVLLSSYPQWRKVSISRRKV